eukprot:1715243-Rhodomonas_salina.2
MAGPGSGVLGQLGREERVESNVQRAWYAQAENESRTWSGGGRVQAILRTTKRERHFGSQLKKSVCILNRLQSRDGVPKPPLSVDSAVICLPVCEGAGLLRWSTCSLPANL